MKIDDWKFTNHALRRAVDMAIDPDELRSVLTVPKTTTHSRKYNGCWLLKNGHICIAVNPDERVVITVLWDTYDADIGGLECRFERGEFADENEMKRIRDKE